MAAALAPGRRSYTTTRDTILFEFHCWKADLQILEIESLKLVPYVPLSHPFVERLIGTMRPDAVLERLGS